MAVDDPTPAAPLASLTVALGARSYPIHIVPDLPGPALATAVRRHVVGAGRALLVTDSNVGPLYADGVVRALRGAGLGAACLTLPAGEATKSLATVGAVLDQALDAGLQRGDVLIALGGGVVGDVTGFAASILHRGVAFVQAPTTVLSQVDSSVGGKTGVNHAAGKNLIGAFWQPRAVISSVAVLATLPPRERRCGLAEAIKHGFIADAELVRWCASHSAGLTALDPVDTAELVLRCCRIKAAVVEADEREAGHRAVLNLGHTFGHAYERLLGYGTLTHGEAVALGMVWAARLSEREGLAAAGLEGAVVAGLTALGLPVDIDGCGPERPELAALITAARHDKKASGDGVRFVLLTHLGQAAIRRLSWDRIQAVLGS